MKKFLPLIVFNIASFLAIAVGLHFGTDKYGNTGLAALYIFLVAAPVSAIWFIYLIYKGIKTHETSYYKAALLHLIAWIVFVVCLFAFAWANQKTS